MTPPADHLCQGKKHLAGTAFPYKDSTWLDDKWWLIVRGRTVRLWLQIWSRQGNSTRICDQVGRSQEPCTSKCNVTNVSLTANALLSSPYCKTFSQIFVPFSHSTHIRYNADLTMNDINNTFVVAGQLQRRSGYRWRWSALASVTARRWWRASWWNVWGWRGTPVWTWRSVVTGCGWCWSPEQKYINIILSSTTICNRVLHIFIFLPVPWLNIFNSP